VFSGACCQRVRKRPPQTGSSFASRAPEKFSRANTGSSEPRAEKRAHYASESPNTRTGFDIFDYDRHRWSNVDDGDHREGW